MEGPETDRDALWVFGYGSLMWHPGFAHDEAVTATLTGYHRGFVMRSIHHRGTPERPGLVLALDAAPGMACTGMAFRVTPGTEDRTMRDLRERELVSYAYKEMVLPLDLADGRRVAAVSYVIDRDHVQYSGPLPLDEQARIIAMATGGRGPNADYLFNTHTHLRALEIDDPDIAWLAEKVRGLIASS